MSVIYNSLMVENTMEGNITAVCGRRETVLLFTIPSITPVSTTSGFNIINFFHVMKEDSLFNCPLLLNMGHSDICLKLWGSGLKEMFSHLSFSKEALSNRNTIWQQKQFKNS